METIAGTARMPPDAAIASIDMAAKAGLSKKRLRQTVKAMEDAQEEYKVRWQAIRDFQLPFIGEFIDRGDTENRAKRRDTKIWNSAAWESCQVFAAGIMSGLTTKPQMVSPFFFRSGAFRRCGGEPDFRRADGDSK